MTSPLSPVIELRSISVRHPSADRDTLSNVSLSVSAGELVVLVGPNGAGKSTLLRVASFEQPPTRGEVWLHGLDAAKLSREEKARNVAVVAQSEPVAFGFTVREVVAMGRAPHQGAWLRMTPEDHSVVNELLERCDLASLAHRPASTLSGGEQRRVALARALAQKPKVLLLDELTAPFDLRHQVSSMNLVRELVTKSGIACLAVTHDLSQAARAGSRIGLLSRGELVRVGTPAEVLREELLGDVFGIRLRVGTDAETGFPYILPRDARSG